MKFWLVIFAILATAELQSQSLLVLTTRSGAAAASGMVVSEPTPAISSSTDTSSYATASFTPTANRLVLVMVINTKATAADTCTLSGNGMTWVELTNTAYAATLSRITLFRGMSASPSAGALTATFGATQTSAIIRVIEVSNTDTTGSNGSGAIVQTPQTTGGTANPSMTMTALNANGLNAAFAFSGNSLGTYGGTEEAGWTENYDAGHPLPNQSGYISYDIDSTDNTVAITASAANWGLIGVEVKAP